jgi:hypothetical protein
VNVRKAGHQGGRRQKHVPNRAGRSRRRDHPLTRVAVLDALPADVRAAANRAVGNELEHANGTQNAFVAAAYSGRYPIGVRHLRPFAGSNGLYSKPTIPFQPGRGIWRNRRTLYQTEDRKMRSTTLADVERMKDALRASLPDVKSSHRVEALARVPSGGG